MYHRGRDPFQNAHVATFQKCASFPLGPFPCQQPPSFHRVTAYKRTFPGSGASLLLSNVLQNSELGGLIRTVGAEKAGGAKLGKCKRMTLQLG